MQLRLIFDFAKSAVPLLSKRSKLINTATLPTPPQNLPSCLTQLALEIPTFNNTYTLPLLQTLQLSLIWFKRHSTHTINNTPTFLGVKIAFQPPSHPASLSLSLSSSLSLGKFQQF